MFPEPVMGLLLSSEDERVKGVFTLCPALQELGPVPAFRVCLDDMDAHMPPEPSAACAGLLPLKGSLISTISRTMGMGVKN
jgi:hypothetical protein